MIWLMAYIVIAVLMVELDGLSCYVGKRYFDLAGSVMIGLIWPISIPAIIYVMWKECKKYERIV